MPPAESSQLLAEEFADFFVDKIKKIRENLNQYDLLKPAANESITMREFFLPLSKLEVQKLVMEMQTNLHELDLIPTKLLKGNTEKLMGLLNNIVNTSLVSGMFAGGWKTALLHPLIKKVGFDVIKPNFHPVSNLSFISCLVEKAAIGQFVQHVDYDGLTPHYQSAYRKNHSCETSLLRLLNDTLWAMEQQQATILIIMDLSAAFDMVHHDILLLVLNKRFGFQGVILNWVESYLWPRHFKVCIGDTKSTLRQLKQSEPQSSVGGPNLFNFYCSTITSVIPGDLDIYLGAFANDTNLRKSFQPSVPNMKKDSLTAMELCLDNIITWLNMNWLKINPTKAELMYIPSQWQIKKYAENSIRVGTDMVEGLLSSSYWVLG